VSFHLGDGGEKNQALLQDVKKERVQTKRTFRVSLSRPKGNPLVNTIRGEKKRRGGREKKKLPLVLASSGLYSQTSAGNWTAAGQEGRNLGGISPGNKSFQ